MSFRNVFVKWQKRYFSDEEAVNFALLFIFFFASLIFLGSILMPFLIAVVITYLLEGIVKRLKRIGLSEMQAVLLSFGLFMGILVALIFWLIPLSWHQLVSLVRDFPSMIRTGQSWLNELHVRYPHFISQEQINNIVNDTIGEMRQFGHYLVSISLSGIPGLLALLVYLILVPILVFFMLKDRRQLLDFVASMMPQKRTLMSKIWQEMDDQIANYIRGKVLEIIIVAIVTWICFFALGLHYAELLAVLVGLSVLVPYLGAAVVTVPVALVALFQFGVSGDFVWVLVVYGIIQLVDGNLLATLLYSETVNIHPVSTILAVLFFGGIWGFWGVFFAIPLATLLKAIFNTWPHVLEETRHEDHLTEQSG